MAAGNCDSAHPRLRTACATTGGDPPLPLQAPPLVAACAAPTTWRSTALPRRHVGKGGRATVMSPQDPQWWLAGSNHPYAPFVGNALKWHSYAYDDGTT